MLLRILSRVAALGFLATALVAAPAVGAPFVNGEFKVSSLETNNKIAAGPDGNMWVTLNDLANDVAKITPSGKVEEFDIEANGASGITAGPDGNMWVTHPEEVVKFSPTNPAANTSIPIAQIKAGSSIVAGSDGNLWVATEGNLIRIEPGTGNFKRFETPGLVPKDIDVAESLLVIASFERIVTATPQDPPVVTDYPIPGTPQGVAGGPGGQIAYTQPVNEPKLLGLFTPPGSATATTTKFPGADPFGIALGSDGAYWSAEFNGDQLIRLTTANQATMLGGFEKGSGPRQIAAGPGNTLWVTLQNTSKVARVSGLEVPGSSGTPPVTPDTEITKGPKKKVKTRQKRAKVRFRFKSPNAGATFECALTKLRKKKKGKPSPKPRFSTCRSPQGYRVPVGRYRFEVRAVLAGVVDPTPDTRTFRVIRKR